ncbi:MAG: alpha/beta hydrolase [Acidobacteria bacterium]|nr:alpha/beta hydrolase [Acidobacteriota bacterium]
MKTTECRFTATPEKGEVSAILIRPEKATRLLVLAHGAGADMRSSAMQSIAEAMARENIATFRYNFPYKEAGKSGVDSPKTATATVRSAVREAARLEPKLKLLAGGHSFGGRMTTTAQSQEPLENVVGLVLCSFPLHAPGRAGIERAEHLKAIKVPMIFHSGTRDEFADLDLWQPVVKKLGKRATLHLIDTGNHSYKVLKKTRTSTEDVFDEIARTTREWVDNL